TLHSQIGFALAAIVAAAAFLKGDEPERIGAGAFMIGVFATQLVHDPGALTGPQWSLIAVDLAFLAVCIALAWKSRRTWPVWASAFQSLAVASHLLTLVDLRPPLAAFYAVVNLAGYGVLASIGLGTLVAWRERRAAALPCRPRVTSRLPRRIFLASLRLAPAGRHAPLPCPDLDRHRPAGPERGAERLRPGPARRSGPDRLQPLQALRSRRSAAPALAVDREPDPGAR